MAVKLKDICSFQSGGTPSRTNNEYFHGTIPWITTVALNGRTIGEESAVEWITEKAIAESAAKVVPERSIMVGTRVGVGKVALNAVPMSTNQDIISLVGIDESRWDKGFLCKFLQSKEPLLKTQARGATIKGIKIEALSALDVPELSLIDQKSVVKTLESILDMIALRKAQLFALDDLVKARFVEMFGNPVRNPKGWKKYLLEDCLERIDNGKSFVCADTPRTGAWPAVLKLSAATYGDYRPNENKALLDNSLFINSAEVHNGDLLFTRKNTPELVGMAAYVHETPSKLMMPDLIFRLVPNEKMNPVFLWQLINCKEFRPIIQAISGGSAKSMSNISKERLGKISVICPPREHQDAFVPLIHQVYKSKFVIQQSLNETQKLFDSLMQQYFG